MLARILAHPLTERTIVALIVLNAAVLGLETSRSVMEAVGPALTALDHALLAVFTVEIVARIAVHRTRFFRDPWSLFDLLVVGISLLPTAGSESLSVLRALRVLRVLRLITVIPSLRRVVGGLVSSLPGMGAVSLLLALVFYVFSVMATKLFGATNPEQFGSLGATSYTLFQVMTFDDWSGGIVKPLAAEHPYAVVFFLAFILLSTFMALNLFIGVIVNALEVETEPKPHAPNPTEARLLEELAAIRAELAELRAAPVEGSRAA